MLEKGSSFYHQPVLKLLYEYLKLQNPNSMEMKRMADTIMTVATQHIKVRPQHVVQMDVHACVERRRL